MPIEEQGSIGAGVDVGGTSVLSIPVVPQISDHDVRHSISVEGFAAVNALTKGAPDGARAVERQKHGTAGARDGIDVSKSRSKRCRFERRDQEIGKPIQIQVSSGT